jgi:alpha-galactosidase
MTRKDALAAPPAQGAGIAPANSSTPEGRWQALMPRVNRAQLLARGIGVHAPSRLTWKLDGEWSELRTSAALDDEIAGNEGGGTVVFVIVVDGEERFRSPLMTHADGPLPIPPIALVGARELVLEVEIGDDSFALDRADWLRPVLVRKP